MTLLYLLLESSAVSVAAYPYLCCCVSVCVFTNTLKWTWTLLLMNYSFLDKLMMNYLILILISCSTSDLLTFFGLGRWEYKVERGLPIDCKNPQQADTILRKPGSIENGSTSASAIALDNDEVLVLTSGRSKQIHGYVNVL